MRECPVGDVELYLACARNALYDARWSVLSVLIFSSQPSDLLNLFIIYGSYGFLNEINMNMDYALSDIAFQHVMVQNEGLLKENKDLRRKVRSLEKALYSERGECDFFDRFFIPMFFFNAKFSVSQFFRFEY